MFGFCFPLIGLLTISMSFGSSFQDSPKIEEPTESPSIRERSLGLQELQNGSLESAIIAFQRYYSYAISTEEQLDAVTLLTEAYLQHDDLDKIQPYLDKIVPLNHDSQSRLYLLQIKLAFAQGKFDELQMILGKFNSIPSVKSEIKLEAFCFEVAGYINMQDLEKAQNACSKLIEMARLEKNQEWIGKGLMNQAVIAFLLNQKENAQKSINEVRLVFPQMKNECDLLELLLNANQLKSEQLLESYKKATETHFSSQIIAIVALKLVDQLTVKDFDTCKFLLDDAFQRATNKNIQRTALLKLASLQKETNRINDAIVSLTKYRRAFRNESDFMAISLQCARLALESDQMKLGFSIYTELLNHPDITQIDKCMIAREYAERLFQDKQYDEAIQWFQYMRNKGITDEVQGCGLYRIAEIKLLQNKYQSALSYFQQVSIQYPSYRDRARYQAMHIQFSHFQQLQSALETASQILRDGKDKTILEDTHFFYAFFLYRKGDLKNALEQFNTFIKNFPQHSKVPDSYRYAGEIYLKFENYNLAIEKFSALINQFPQSHQLLPAKRFIIQALSLSGDEAATLEGIRKLVNDYPDAEESADALFLQFDIAFAKSAYQEALSVLDKIIMMKKTPQFAQRALFEKSRLLFHLNQVDNALQTLQLLEEDYTQLFYEKEVIFLKAEIQASLRKYKEAALLLEKLIPLTGNNTQKTSLLSEIEILATLRAADYYQSEYAADAIYDIKVLDKAQSLYQSLLSQKQIPAVMLIEIRYKIGHLYRLQGNDALGLGYFEQCIGDAELYPLIRQESTHWILKAGFDGLDTCEKIGTVDAFKRAIKICDRIIAMGLDDDQILEKKRAYFKQELTILPTSNRQDY